MGNDNGGNAVLERWIAKGFGMDEQGQWLKNLV